MPMSMGKYRIRILSLIIFISLVNILYAGTTGKIAGRILDKETGEPLPGVNILVEGTTLGSTTDINGYYVILQVPPGIHTIIASMVGYTKVSITEVRVFIDQTATVDIELQSETIEMKTITVIARRDLVKKDVSTSVTSIQTADIEVLPVASIDELASLQAGIQEGLVVRGGQSDQLLLQMDGITLRDPRNNRPISSVALTSIQEVSIERGGFNAEYGQVRSGIINIITKEGSANSFHGSLQLRYSPATQKHFGLSVYDPNSMWNRPYLDPEVAFIGTENGWDEYTARQYPRFDGWNSISQALLSDDDPNNDLSPAAAQQVWMWERRRRPTIAPDYNIDASFGGPIPLIGKPLGNLRFFASYRFEREMLLIPLSRDDYREDNWSVKLNSDLTESMKLMITGSTGVSRNVAINADDAQFNNPAWGINGVQFWNPTDYMRSPFQIAEITNEQRPSRIFTNSWYSEAVVGHLTLAAKLTDFINPTTFYEISLENVNRNYSTGPVTPRDLTRKYEVVPGYFVDEAPFGWDSLPNAGITSMFFGGHSATSRDSSEISSYILKADLTSQLTNEHMVKTGIEFSYYDLNLDYGRVNNYFNDINYVKETMKPYRVSFYAQDKIEALGFIANIGVRLDISNPNSEWVVVDPFDKAFFSTDYSATGDYPKEKAKTDIAVSPRLGISHPITENSKLYFNYGHFKQFPAYEEIFRLGRGSAGSIRNYGDPNLQQAKTIAYELGYDHVLFDEYQIQVAAFYNDISNQQGYTSYLSDRKGIGYFAANNDLYADIRGFELTLRKTQGNWIRGFLTYTYQVSTNGAFGKQTIDEDPSQQIQLDRNTTNLYQQKPIPQPRANLSLTFFTPKEFGPEFLGTQPLGDWSLNVIGAWEAGEWINYNPNLVQEIGTIIQNVQVVDYYNIDLRLLKTFDFEQFSVSFFMEVRNLLNSKFLSGASFYSGLNGGDEGLYLESLHLPKSQAYSNIPGDDRVGDYREADVPYQPIEQSGNVFNISVNNINPSVIYYDTPTGRYMNFVNGSWSEVDSNKMQKILDDKAYIDMPNNSSFDFLNPRQIFFGLNLSFNF